VTDFTFIIATILPPALVVWIWYMLWRMPWWLRLSGVLLAIAFALVAGGWMIFSLADFAYPNSRSPGMGVVAVPMTLVLAVLSVVIVCVELSRFASKVFRLPKR
jgi:hypothetical protein